VVDSSVDTGYIVCDIVCDKVLCLSLALSLSFSLSLLYPTTAHWHSRDGSSRKAVIPYHPSPTPPLLTSTMDTYKSVGFFLPRLLFAFLPTPL